MAGNGSAQVFLVRMSREEGRTCSSSLPMPVKVQSTPNLIYSWKIIPNGPQRSSSKARDGWCQIQALSSSTSPEWLMGHRYSRDLQAPRAGSG